MIRLMPARLTPSSWLSRCTSRSSATSRWLYRRPPPPVRPGCTRPSRSYWRSVWGCIPASRAATEMISTFASEACSIEMSISSHMCHLLIEGSIQGCLSETAETRFDTLPPRRWCQLGEPFQRVPGLVRDDGAGRHLHLDGDQQVAGLA